MERVFSKKITNRMVKKTNFKLHDTHRVRKNHFLIFYSDVCFFYIGSYTDHSFWLFWFLYARIFKGADACVSCFIVVFELLFFCIIIDFHKIIINCFWKRQNAMKEKKGCWRTLSRVNIKCHLYCLHAEYSSLSQTNSYF